MQLIQGNCFEVLEDLPYFDMVFCDPFDNIGLKYNSYKDKIPEEDYVAFLEDVVYRFTEMAPTIWISFNAIWTHRMGAIVSEFLDEFNNWEFKPCVQTYTFGQHRSTDLGNGHRPLWRLKKKKAPIYPDQARVPSWRLLNGDSRANPEGKVPSTHFDFPRVTGNSEQRRRWHVTQLHEGLIERCILLSTKEGDRVLDPFAGTGTTLRVCKKINRDCTLIELDPKYCDEIRKEHSDCIGRAA